MENKEALAWFKEYSRIDGHSPNHKPSLCAIRNIELVEKIKKRVNRYYKCENLHKDSSSQAIFDILMLLQDFDKRQ